MKAKTQALNRMKQPTPEMPNIEVIAVIIDMVTTNKNLEFNGGFYHQAKAVPMWNVLSPMYSSLFMGGN